MSDSFAHARGPWSSGRIESFLAATRAPLRLACNGASGHPVLASLWFAPIEGKLWCATQQTARVIALLDRDPRCAFEVAEDRAPYCGVRGQGHATVHGDRGEPTLRTLIDRYLDAPDGKFARWLLSRAEGEVAIAIEPRSLLSWDFSDRMGGSR